METTRASTTQRSSTTMLSQSREAQNRLFAWERGAPMRKRMPEWVKLHHHCQTVFCPHVAVHPSRPSSSRRAERKVCTVISALVLLGAVTFTLVAAYQWAGRLRLLNAGRNGQTRAWSTALVVWFFGITVAPTLESHPHWIGSLFVRLRHGRHMPGYSKYEAALPEFRRLLCIPGK